MQEFHIRDIVFVDGDLFRGIGQVIGVMRGVPSNEELPRGFKADQPVPQVQVWAMSDMEKPGRTLMYNAEDIKAGKLSLLVPNNEQKQIELDHTLRRGAYSHQNERKKLRMEE